VSGTYEQIGSAADVEQISPYADQAWNMITQMLGGNIEGDILGQWLGSIPQIQGIAAGVTSPYGQARMEQAMAESRRIQSDIAGSYAKGGALRSSAAAQAIGRGVGQTRLGAMADIIGREQGLVGQLTGISSGLLGQGLAARAGMMGAAAQFGQPTYYEPSYEYKPGLADYFISLLGAAGQAAGGISGFFPPKVPTPGGG